MSDTQTTGETPATEPTEPPTPAPEESGRVLDTALGARFRDEVLAVGGSRPAMDSFVAFRGRKPQIDALLRLRGMT